MTPERWHQVSRIFHEALARDEAARQAFVRDACAADPELRQEILAMLDAHAAAGQFGQQPIPVIAPRLRQTLAPGTTLGPYRIEAAAGAGGMGEVYRAIDGRLDRPVAIKVLPELTASDPDARRRFEREARTVAALSHPNICALFDVGEQDGLSFLVMEYLEGETLAKRLGSGPLPLAQALRYAAEIADALDKAHRRGIVHRDLKPANIMLTSTGAKLLDFGLAKAVASRATDISTAVTSTGEPLTGRGMLLGTLPYMAPEQVQGRDADARTDIFAFGSVVYEMLTGARAFEADSQATLIASILRDHVPPVSVLQPLTPATLERAIGRCLEKDPEDRWQSAGDLKHEIQRIADDLKHEPPRIASKPRWLMWVAVASAGAIVWFVAAYLPSGPGTGPAAARFSVALPAGLRMPMSMTALPMAVSPDGSRIVFTASDATGAVHLYLRTLSHESIRPLPGTDGGFAPFFSPDGKWIGFAASGGLKKVLADGGPVLSIADGVLDKDFGGATWGADDTIVFAPTRLGGLAQVAASGGVPRVLTTPLADHGEVSHFLPQFLPGNRAVLFTMRSGLNGAPSRVEVLSIDTGLRQVIAPSASNAQYAATGHVVFAGNGLLAGSLWAAPFDMTRLTVTGRTVRALDSILTPGGLGMFALSPNGTLTYLPRTGRAAEELVWAGVHAQPESEPVVDAPGNIMFPRLSRDGTRLAITLREGASPATGIWLFDMRRPTAPPTLFSNQSTNDHLPVWTPDGSHIVFSSLRDGENRDAAGNLYWKRVDDAGEAERLTTSPQHHDPASWSADGTLLFFAEQRQETRQDVWVLNIRDRTRRPVLQSAARERHPMISPDGRWLAYASDETGTEEVYVQGFPGGEAKQRVSTTGGNEPLWSRDGRRLFYRRAMKEVVAVAVTSGSTLTVGASSVVVEGDYEGAAGAGAPNFEASLDGRRFLMIRHNDVSATAGTHLDVILNWFAELSTRRVP